MVRPEHLKQAQTITEEVRKIALERRMLPDIRSLFSQMVDEYVATLTATASVPSAANFQNEWASAFLRQYRRVGREFLPNQRRSKFYAALLIRKQELTPEENAGLLDAYASWSRSFGANQASLVTRTNQRDYTTALQKATEQVADGASPAVIAAAAGVALRRIFRGREETIANVQTQAPAENAKRLEATSLGRSEGLQDDQIKKTWKTVGDEKVRSAHVAADGQMRNANEAFSVGGENLMFPGDTSLGASAGNVINCRCAAIWL